jgi:predicted nucleotidyltransferase
MRNNSEDGQSPHLRAQDLAIVRDVLKDLPENAKVFILGSRATGTRLKPFSDLDIALDLGKPLESVLKYALQEAFEESDLPYRVDILDLQTVSKSFLPFIEKDFLPLL